MSKIPSFAELQNFRVNRSDDYEGIRQSLYDSQTYAAAGQTSLTFFQVPIGQAGKTRADTNMETAGTLPQPKNFLAESIELHILPAIDPSAVDGGVVGDGSEFANDVYKILSAGFLELFIGSKTYLTEAPLMKFPPKTRMELSAAESVAIGDAGAAINFRDVYAAGSGRPYYLDPAILLEPTQNFNVSLNWPTAVAISADLRIFVSMDGVLYRLSQ